MDDLYVHGFLLGAMELMLCFVGHLGVHVVAVTAVSPEAGCGVG